MYVTRNTEVVYGPPEIFYHVHAGVRYPWSNYLNSGSKHLGAAKSLYSRYVNKGCEYVELCVRERFPIGPRGGRDETYTSIQSHGKHDPFKREESAELV